MQWDVAKQHKEMHYWVMKNIKQSESWKTLNSTNNKNLKYVVKEGVNLEMWNTVFLIISILENEKLRKHQDQWLSLGMGGKGNDEQ